MIPAGRFLMGSPEDEFGHRADEEPQHEVTFARPFALGRYTVTYAEYDRFAAATGGRLPRDWGYGRGDLPVDRFVFRGRRSLLCMVVHTD